MKILNFEKTEPEIDNTLSHISISVVGDNYKIKEERGLNEYIKTIETKDKLNEYLKEVLCLK